MPIKVFSPEGKFSPDLIENNNGQYILLAAGSGITPIMSILKSILAFERESTVTLLYGNRSEQDIIFKSQLDFLEEKYPDRLKVFHTLSKATETWSGAKGRISEKLIASVIGENLQNPDRCSFFICGPGGLIEESEKALIQKGIKKEQIKHEFFTKDKSEKSGPAVSEGSTALTILLDNEQHQIDIDSQTTVLEAAIDAGLDAPFSCKIAACCTCKAKVLEGEVSMEDDEILTEVEKTEGFILTCQAYSTSEKLVISYDDA